MMSYCRFSSDDWRSDVYVYESECGFQIHVAGNRIVGDIPSVTVDLSDTDAFLLQYRAQMDTIAVATREKIILPYAGEYFVYTSAGETADWLEHLREVGYRIPGGVIEMLREEERGLGRREITPV